MLFSSITVNKTKPENFKTIHIFQKSLYNYYSPEHNFLKIVRQQFHINHNFFNQQVVNRTLLRYCLLHTEINRSV